jgi:hypothetical protein
MDTKTVGVFKEGVTLLLYAGIRYWFPAKTINHVESELETDVPSVYSITVRNTDPDDRDNKYPKRRLHLNFIPISGRR